MRVVKWLHVIDVLHDLVVRLVLIPEEVEHCLDLVLIKRYLSCDLSQLVLSVSLDLDPQLPLDRHDGIRLLSDECGHDTATLSLL